MAIVVEVARPHPSDVRADGVIAGPVQAEREAVFQDFEVGPMCRGSKRALSPVMALARPRGRIGGCAANWGMTWFALPFKVGLR